MKHGWGKRKAYMWKLSVKVLALIFFFLGIFFVLPQKVLADAPNVTVHVVNALGTGVPGVTLTWTDKNGRTRTEVSDASGNATFISWQKVSHPDQDNNAFGCLENTHTISASGANGTYDRSIRFDLENNENAIDIGNITYTPLVVTPTVDLKINGSDGPVTVDHNATVSLSWSTTNNPQVCTASGTWSGGRSGNGNDEKNGPLSGGTAGADFSYTLTCSNSAGSANDTVSVRVNRIPKVLTVDDAQIKNLDGTVASTVIPDGVTQYVLTTTGTDGDGVADIGFQFAGISVGGSDVSNARGLVGWTGGAVDWWPAGDHSVPIDCTSGGGKAAKYTNMTNNNGYGSAYMNLISCSTTTSGNNSRTVNFVVTFNPNFAAPLTGNKIDGLIRDVAKAGPAWGSFGNFSIVVAPTNTDASISSVSVKTDETTLYTITTTATDPQGGNTIKDQMALINFASGEPNGRGYLAFTTAATFWQSHTLEPQNCTGGGKAAKHTNWGSGFIHLQSCKTTVTGTERKVEFEVIFDPSFTTPLTNNIISAHVRDENDNADATGWDPFDTFSIVPISTVSYKISETVVGLDVAPEKPYLLDKDGNLITDYTFINPKIGANTVFVSYKDSRDKWGGCGANQSQPCSAQIELIAQPTMGSCVVDTSNPNQITFDIFQKPGVGNGYGTATGKVEMGDVELQNLKLVRWDDNHIKAVLSGQPLDQEFQLKITDAKGLSVEGVCSSLSQLSLGTRLFCRAPQATTLSDVDFILAEGKNKGKITRSKVTIDKKGVVQGLNQKLVENEGYKISIKVPKSVRKNIEFYAGAGTSILNNIRLPVGDIFPLDGGDGRINSADAAELFREWRVLGSGAEKPGDFNGDGLINSFEWACMRFDFGASDDEEPVPGPLSKANPNKAAVQTKQGGLSSQSAGIGVTGSSGVGATN